MDHAYGSAILIRDSLSVEFVPQMSNNYTSCIELKVSGSSIRFLSVYLLPSHADPSALLRQTLTELGSSNAVLSIDSNAKNVLWGSLFTDRGGS